MEGRRGKQSQRPAFQVNSFLCCCSPMVIIWLSWMLVCVGVAMYKIKWGKCNALRMNVSIIKIDEGTSENVQQNIIAMT